MTAAPTITVPVEALPDIAYAQATFMVPIAKVLTKAHAVVNIGAAADRLLIQIHGDAPRVFVIGLDYLAEAVTEYAASRS